MRARAALEGGKRHEIDGRVLKVAESNSMSSVANCSERRGCSAGAAGRGHDRDHDKEFAAGGNRRGKGRVHKRRQQQY